MDIRRNNFDLLRLFAAMQVAFNHTLAHLDVKSPILGFISIILSSFPGVPIFFMMSGFLITASYEKNANLKQYALNRILRIYPALWVAFIITTVIIISAGYLHLQNLRDFIFWAFCQTGIFQFYNPFFLRGFGVGVVNGSLWTISVELQFYAIVPILYVVLRKYNHQVKLYWFIYIIAVCVGYFFTQIPNIDKHVTIQDQSSIYLIILKLSKLTLLPYLYCFLIGVLCRIHINIIQKLIVGKLKFFVCLAMYMIFFICLRGSVSFDISNPIVIMLLAIPVFAFAFSFPNLSHVLLGNVDFSYGLYIYHMLIVNVFIYFGLVGNWYFLPMAIVISMFFSAFSWFLIEQPALALKYNSLRRMVVGSNIELDKKESVVFR